LDDIAGSLPTLVVISWFVGMDIGFVPDGEDEVVVDSNGAGPLAAT